MKYKKMSDLAINEKVANLDGFTTHISAGHVMAYHGFEDGAQVYCAVDYCNNPNDAWPVIELIWDDLMTIDFGNECNEWERVANGMPCGKLRAAMVLFLKMNED